MTGDAWHEVRAATLWSVKGHRLRESYPPRRAWWWDNRARRPAECVVVQYIRRGRLVWRERGADREMGPGDLFLFAFGEDTAYGRPPDRPDWPGHTDHLQMDHVTLRGAGLRAYWELFRARHGSVLAVPDDAPCLAALAALCAEQVPVGSASVVAVAEFVAELARAVEGAAGASRPPIEQAVEEILTDPCGEHNLKAIARRFGCSREHLSRVFMERVGQPPVTWMRDRRLARAVDLLRETGLPATVVAVQCGAGSLHRLARWTKAAFGCSPSELATRLKRGWEPGAKLPP